MTNPLVNRTFFQAEFLGKFRDLNFVRERLYLLHSRALLQLLKGDSQVAAVAKRFFDTSIPKYNYKWSHERVEYFFGSFQVLVRGELSRSTEIADDKWAELFMGKENCHLPEDLSQVKKSPNAVEWIFHFGTESKKRALFVALLNNFKYADPRIFPLAYVYAANSLEDLQSLMRALAFAFGRADKPESTQAIFECFKKADTAHPSEGFLSQLLSELLMSPLSRRSEPLYANLKLIDGMLDYFERKPDLQNKLVTKLFHVSAELGLKKTVDHLLEYVKAHPECKKALLETDLRGNTVLNYAVKNQTVGPKILESLIDYFENDPPLLDLFLNGLRRLPVTYIYPSIIPTLKLKAKYIDSLVTPFALYNTLTTAIWRGDQTLIEDLFACCSQSSKAMTNLLFNHPLHQAVSSKSDPLPTLNTLSRLTDGHPEWKTQMLGINGLGQTALHAALKYFKPNTSFVIDALISFCNNDPNLLKLLYKLDTHDRTALAYATNMENIYPLYESLVPPVEVGIKSANSVIKSLYFMVLDSKGRRQKLENGEKINMINDKLFDLLYNFYLKKQEPIILEVAERLATAARKNCGVYAPPYPENKLILGGSYCHAVLYAIDQMPDKTFNFSEYNSGEGYTLASSVDQYHVRKYVGIKPEELSSTFFNELHGYQRVRHYSNVTNQIKHFFSKHTLCLKSEHKKQKNSSCTYKCFPPFLREKFGVSLFREFKVFLTEHLIDEFTALKNYDPLTAAEHEEMLMQAKEILIKRKRKASE